MDYSIHDAVEAGFNKIIFIIRRDIEKDFREVIGNRMEELCERLQVEIGYAFQDLHDLPEGVELSSGKNKALGDRAGGAGLQRSDPGTLRGD